MRVLIVDADATNRELLRAVLASGGHEIVEAADGLQALKALRLGKFEAVISDVLMPGMDGYRLCYTVRRSRPLKDLPFIIYTSTYTSPSDEQLALSVGADRFLTKPVPAAVILEALEKARSGPRPSRDLTPPTQAFKDLKRYSEGLVRRLEHKNQELEASERRYRDIVSLAPIGIYRATREGRFVSVNAAFVRLLGYETTEEVLSLELESDVYFDPSDRERLIAENEGVGGQPSFEIRLKRRDGSPFWARIQARAIRGESGTVEHFEGFVYDIDEREKAEVALRQSEERFRSLIEASRDGIVIIDSEGMLKYASPSAESLTGYRLEELLGRNAFSLVHPEDVPGLKARLADMLGEVPSGLPVPISFRLRHRDGRWRFFEVVASNEVGDTVLGGFVLSLRDVTERKEREESIQKLLLAVEQTEDAIYMTDPNGTITYVNPGFEKLYGYSREEAQGKTPRILKSGQHDKAFYERFWKRLLSGGAVREQFVNRRRGGQVAVVEASVSSVLDVKGKRIGFIAVQSDVTERKRAEEALRESERRFSLAFHASPVPTSIREIETNRYVDVNDQFVRVLGYPREELIGRTPAQVGLFVKSEDLKSIVEGIAREGVVELEIQLRGRSGELHDVVGSATLIEVGSMPCVLATFLDVTDRKRAEKGLRKSEERFRRLFDSNTIGITVADLSGRTLEANDAYLAMIGYTREELLSGAVRWDAMTPVEDRERDQIAVGQLQRMGTAQPYEKELIRKDGTRVPLLIGIAMLEASERSVIAYTVDLSSRRQLEEQLRQSQKMEAVGQLAGGIAHDFNNLLTAILGYAGLLATQAGQGSPLSELIEEIRKAGERAASLTQQLLAFSRRQVLLPEILDLNGIVTEMHNMLRRVIGEDVELIRSCAPDLAPVKADRGQIEQVLMNLAVNARDAMPKGGRLTIETANVTLDESYVRNHAVVLPGPYVLLAVSDTGVGMDADTLSHMFEPFFTTKEKGKGTGLGLATVYGIVKQSGGYVWVYSEPGHGTTFKVYLPRVGEEQEAPRGAAPAVAEDASGSETILLVEDEEAVRRLVRIVLEGKGYTVLEASGWQEALAIAGQQKSIDLVITDVVMPGVGGPELALRLEAARPGIRVLYMSGYTNGAVVDHGLLSSATAFLQKPFTPSTLLRKVREVLSS